MLAYRSIKKLSVSMNIFRKKLHTGQQPLSAGHSKWANIKHIKAQKDGQRATTFTKLSRQIRLAVQEGGSSDIVLNTKLNSVVEEALRKNMPMSTIQSNIKKIEQSKNNLKKYRLELLFKQKIFLICIVYSDNFSGLKMELSSVIKKLGAVYAEISHMFEEFGVIEATYDKCQLHPEQCIEERIIESGIEAGAEEVNIIDSKTGDVQFICSPSELFSVSKVVKTEGYRVHNMDTIYTAKNLVALSSEDLKAYNSLITKLRSISGIEDIYDNVMINETL